MRLALPVDVLPPGPYFIYGGLLCRRLPCPRSRGRIRLAQSCTTHRQRRRGLAEHEEEAEDAVPFR